jgi:hypothetical protein
MASDWQNLVALLLVAVAAVYVGWALIRAARRKKTSGCGSCASCPAASQPTLIAIEPKKK